MENKLQLKDAKTLALASLGGALEFYDFIIFVFFTKTLSELFFPIDMPAWLSQIQVYGIFAAGYLARPLGGVIMAHFGDTTGRKKMFTLSVFMMAIPTLAIGLLPTYQYIGVMAPLLLLFLRLIQGLAIGGEVPAAWVFVAEHVPRQRIGFACACLTSGLTAGILLGSLTASAIYSFLPSAAVLSFGWRIPFILGGVFGLAAVWLRKWLHETPVFEELKKKKAISRDIPLKIVFKENFSNVLLSFFTTWLLTAAIVVVILMTPTLVQTIFNVPVQLAYKGNNLASFFLIFGCLLGGLLSDRIGRFKALLLGSLMLMISTLTLYLDLQNGAQNFIPLYSVTGLLVGVVGIVPTIMIHAFPPAVRFSGISFSYNMAYAFFGALTPPLISYLSNHIGPLAPAYYVLAAGLVAIFISLSHLKKD